VLLPAPHPFLPLAVLMHPLARRPRVDLVFVFW
jgi:hypothetical protein